MNLIARDFPRMDIPRTKGEYRDVQNVPAEEAAPQEGARLPQENGDAERAQGFGPPQSEGQSSPDLLILLSGEVTVAWPFFVLPDLEKALSDG